MAMFQAFLGTLLHDVSHLLFAAMQDTLGRARLMMDLLLPLPFSNPSRRRKKLSLGRKTMRTSSSCRHMGRRTTLTPMYSLGAPLVAER